MAKRNAHGQRIRRGDTVVVVAGADKGTRGRVLRVIPDKSRVVVEGVNLVHRHIRRSQKHPQGGRLRREAAVDLSNVMLIDPSDDLPTRIGRVLKDAEKGSLGWSRIAKRTGNEVGEAAAKPTKKKAKRSKKDARE